MKCDYVRIYKGFNEQGIPTESRDRCSSKLNLREIEFKHAEYREQNQSCFLCDSHFIEVFGDIDETEKKSMRDYLNAKSNFNKSYAMARSQMEYFEPQGFRDQNYPKVERALDKWQKIKKKLCRYEDCDVDLATIRRVFVVRVYSQSGREWANYYFCSKEHWTKIKYRIGIEKPDMKTQKQKVQSLDDYTEKISDSQTIEGLNFLEDCKHANVKVRN